MVKVFDYILIAVLVTVWTYLRSYFCGNIFKLITNSFYDIINCYVGCVKFFYLNYRQSWWTLYEFIPSFLWKNLFIFHFSSQFTVSIKIIYNYKNTNSTYIPFLALPIIPLKLISEHISTLYFHSVRPISFPKVPMSYISLPHYCLLLKLHLLK